MGLWLRRGVSAFVLSVWAGVPIGSLVCATECVAAASATPVAAERQEAAAACHEAPLASATLDGTSGHDCEHSEPAAAAMLGALRADTTVLSVKHAIAATPQPAPSLVSGDASPSSGAPPGVSSPSRTPLVLRI